jgi:hypothetical protein
MGLYQRGSVSARGLCPGFGHRWACAEGGKKITGMKTAQLPVRNISTEYVGIKESNYDNITVQSFEHDFDITIKGSDIKYTNLRILSDIIPNNEQFNVLNQYYIDNSEKVILTDNADKNIYTTNYLNKNWT